MSISRFFPILFFTLGFGCNGPEDIDDAGALGQKGQFGLIFVSYDHDWTNAGQKILLTSSAQFVKYTAIDQEQVARLLALPIDPKKDLPQIDHCKHYELSVDLLGDESFEEPGTVELLEAGNVHIQTAGQTVTMSPRHFPWLLPFISGVVYGESPSTVFEGVHPVKAMADGNDVIGPFTTQGSSPALPRLKSIEGIEPDQIAIASKGGELVLTWDSNQTHPDDITYLEIRNNINTKKEAALRCRIKDDGNFAIPSGVLSGFGGKVTLEITRLRQTSFSAQGLDRGELRIAVRDRAPVVF